MTKTLLTAGKPAAGGTTLATSAAGTPPPSGGAPPAGEQTATTGEEQAGGETTPAGTTKTESTEGGEQTPGTPAPFTYRPSPEGYVIGGAPSEALTAVARKLNLSNEAAQQIVDVVAPALVAQQEENMTAMSARFKAETEADPVIGGEKLPETLALAARGLALVSPELRQLLDDTGLGNHKLVVAGFAAIGRKVSPDKKVVPGNAPAPPPKTPMERLADTYRKS